MMAVCGMGRDGNGGVLNCRRTWILVKYMACMDMGGYGWLPELQEVLERGLLRVRGDRSVSGPRAV